MTGAQHKIVGTAWGLAASYVAIKTGDPVGSICVFTSVIGCMLPDMDHDKTKLGRKRKAVTGVLGKVVNFLIPFASVVLAGIAIGSYIAGYQLISDMRVILFLLTGILMVAIGKNMLENSETYKWACKHRGLMHTLVVPGIMIASLSVLESFLYWGMIGLAVGYISHLFADMCTKQGIPVLWPLTEENIHLTNVTTDSKFCNVLAWIVASLPIIVVILMEVENGYFRFNA